MGFRETWAEIDLDKLERNYKRIQAYTNTEVFGVVKANAYGHGDIVIARELEALGTPFLCVSSFDEALRLQEAGITQDILIFSYVSAAVIQKHHHPQFVYTVPSEAWYASIQALNMQLRLHIEVNTGMNRYGIKDAAIIRDIVANHEVEGIYMHFQSPENLEIGRRQLQTFETIVASLEKTVKWIHVGNAPTALIADKAWINGSRLGIALYGYRVDMPDLEPILTLNASVTHLDYIQAGETVGYDYTYTASVDEMFATMPIGYADGFDVRNHSVPVSINNHTYPIIGKVCMDQTMIRVDESVKFGDTIQLLGPNRTAKMIHEATGIMPYIQLSTLSDRIERRYLRNQHVVFVNVR